MIFTRSEVTFSQTLAKLQANLVQFRKKSEKKPFDGQRKDSQTDRRWNRKSSSSHAKRQSPHLTCQDATWSVIQMGPSYNSVTSWKITLMHKGIERTSIKHKKGCGSSARQTLMHNPPEGVTQKTKCCLVTSDTLLKERFGVIVCYYKLIIFKKGWGQTYN